MYMQSCSVVCFGGGVKKAVAGVPKNFYCVAGAPTNKDRCVAGSAAGGRCVAGGVLEDVAPLDAP